MKYPSNSMSWSLTRHDYRRGPGAPWDISQTTHQLAQEADATMSPEGWEADYSSPAELAAASPVAVASPVAAAGLLPADADARQL